MRGGGGSKISQKHLTSYVNAPQEVVDEDNNIVTGVEALLEIDNLPVCGLKLTNFTSNYFGWWSCEMGNNDPKSIFHKGTFKINKPNEWPTEIRLPTDVKVNSS